LGSPGRCVRTEALSSEPVEPNAERQKPYVYSSGKRCPVNKPSDHTLTIGMVRGFADRHPRAIGDRHLATRFAVGGCLERLRTNRRLRLPLLLRSKFIGVVLDRMPNWWLIAIQAYRVLGVTFLIGWARATVFALPAGIGDVSVGLVAIPIAYLLATGWRSAPKFAIAWNLLGLLDFTIAIGIGILTTLQIIVPDRPNVALGVFPAVMIPAFAVPSWTLLHALSLRQLRRKLKTNQA